MTAIQINDLFDELDKEKSEFSLVGMEMPCFRKDLMKQLLKNNPENSALYFQYSASSVGFVEKCLNIRRLALFLGGFVKLTLFYKIS